VPARWKLNPRQTGGLIGALVTTLLGFVLLNLNLSVGKHFLNLSYDLPFILRPSQAPDEVMMVYMNDESHRELGPERAPYHGPWDRNVHAALIERLTTEGARAIVFDVLFSGASRDPAADERFARAIQANKRVILAADYVPVSFGPATGMQLVKPYTPFRNAAAGIVVTQLEPEADLQIERHYHGSMLEVPPLFSES